MLNPQLKFMVCPRSEQKHIALERCFLLCRVLVAMGLMVALSVDVFNRFAPMR